MKLARLTPLAGLLLAWQAVCSLGLAAPYLLPSPLAILAGLKELALAGMPPARLLHLHAAHSLLRVAWGFAAALVLALPLGLLMGYAPRLHAALRPMVELVRPVPPLAWIPISILWFGIGTSSAAFIIFLGAFFPILLNTVAGVTSVNAILLEAARTLGAGRRDILLKVLLPGAAPAMFVGLRIGVGIGWMTLLAAEFAGVRSGYGLGHMIMTARDIQRPDLIMAGMAVIGALGLLIDAGLRRLERRLLPWSQGS